MTAAELAAREAQACVDADARQRVAHGLILLGLVFNAIAMCGLVAWIMVGGLTP